MVNNEIHRKQMILQVNNNLYTVKNLLHTSLLVSFILQMKYYPYKAKFTLDFFYKDINISL